MRRARPGGPSPVFFSSSDTHPTIFGEAVNPLGPEDTGDEEAAAEVTEVEEEEEEKEAAEEAELERGPNPLAAPEGMEAAREPGP